MRRPPVQTPEVYCADLRTTPRRNLLDKVEALLDHAGLAGCGDRSDRVAVAAEVAHAESLGLGSQAFRRVGLATPKT